MRRLRHRPAVILALAFFACPALWFSHVLGLDQLKTGAELSAERALNWLKGQQDESGALPGFGGTADGVWAIVAGGQDPGSDKWKSAKGRTPIAFLESEADQYDCRQPDRKDCNAGRAAKIALAAEMIGRDPRNFGGKDLIAGMMADTGPTGVTVSNFSQGYALIALAGAKSEVPPGTITRVVGSQRPDGGWGWAPGVGSDTNSTALLVQALVAVRPVAGSQQALIDSSIERAIGYLAGQQRSDAGFAYDEDPKKQTEPISTAGVILAIRATGGDPKTARWSKQGPDGRTRDTLDALLALQAKDGWFVYPPGTDADPGSTVAAVPAVMEKSLVCLVGLGSCPVLEAPSPPAEDPATDEPALPSPGPEKDKVFPTPLMPLPATAPPPAQSPPALFALEPQHGPVSGGAKVKITGTGLSLLELVHFGPVVIICPSQSCLSGSDRTIDVIAPPARSPGPVPIRLSGSFGRSNELTFTYQAETAPAPRPEQPQGARAPVDTDPAPTSPQGPLPGGGGFTSPGIAATSGETIPLPMDEPATAAPMMVAGGAQSAEDAGPRPELGYYAVGRPGGRDPRGLTATAGIFALGVFCCGAVAARRLQKVGKTGLTPGPALGRPVL